jgi:hypothetical protein
MSRTSKHQNSIEMARWPRPSAVRWSAFALGATLLAANAAVGQSQGQRGFAASPSQEQPEYQSGGYFALIIGIQQYQPPLKSLGTPDHDAQEIAAVLRDQYGFQIQLLLDKDATRINILTALDRYRNTLRTNDSLLIYYAGHGYNDHDADRAYWLPVDADSPDSPNHISADDITAAVRALPSMHVLVVSDSCYSGDLMRDASEATRAEGKPEVIERMIRSRSRNLMTSGGDEPVADGGPDGHSVFAYAFLNALREERDEEFTSAELFYGPVQQEVAGSSQQTPRYSILRNSNHEYGDFVFQQRDVQSRAATVSTPGPGTVAGAPAATITVPPPAQNDAQDNASPASQTSPQSEAMARFIATFSHPALSDPSDSSTPPINPSADDRSNSSGAADLVVIPGRGFNPFFGETHGLSRRVTMQPGSDGSVRAEGGMLYFFGNGPAVDANGKPVGPVSCDSFATEISTGIKAVDRSGAAIPKEASVKISGRSGKATLYMQSDVAQSLDRDLWRMCGHSNLQ